ncbi:hypothetical protein Tco_1307671 [Tanacetum coccineum]
MVAATEPTTIQSAVLKAGMLTDEAIRNGSLKKNTKKRGNGRELGRNENVRDENKRSRTGKAFATITNPCMNCNQFRNFAMDYRAGPRMVTHVNARNPTTARGACFECGGTDHYKAVCPSFDVIIRMDWLSRHKAEIVCHEKVVRIPLPHGEILRVLGGCLMSAKTEEQKLKDIVIFRNFFEVFPDDLSGLPPSQEFEFHIDLIPRAIPITNLLSFGTSEMEELSSQLRELQGQGFHSTDDI